MDNESTVTKTTAEQPAVAERTRSGCCYRPNVDIMEHGDELLVVADVPGASSDSIDVSSRTACWRFKPLCRRGECDGHTSLLREYDVGDYYRSFQVSEAIDAGKISAQYADGVLTLHLPKAEAAEAAEDRRRRQVTLPPGNNVPSPAGRGLGSRAFVVQPSRLRKAGETPAPQGRRGQMQKDTD